MIMNTHLIKARIKNTGLLAASLLLLSAAHAQSKQALSTKSNASVKVYTTAKNTSLKLSPGEDIQFTDPGTMVERKVFVFLDDSHSFQTMLGIGGAITDASAETFARLSPEQQDELVKAYYDQKNGIGYTLARTNMQSCDFS